MARRAVHQDQAVLGLVGWAPHCRRLWDLCRKPTVRYLLTIMRLEYLHFFVWLVSLYAMLTLSFISVLKAKLGDQNKFYYDEKLKRWVEEGAAVPAEEPPLPPPPTKLSFQNGMPDHKLNGPMSGSHAPNGVTEWKSSNSSEQGLGMPPIPPSQNQFSARGRMGVRSR